MGSRRRRGHGSGFWQSRVTILDSNITTMIAAWCLLGIRDRPCERVCVTLMIGLVSNVLTAVFMARIVFDYLYAQNGGRRSAFERAAP